MMRLQQCGHCCTRGSELKKCLGCQAVSYCGKEYAPPFMFAHCAAWAPEGAGQTPEGAGQAPEGVRWAQLLL
jgi:hypothetical protein